MILRYLKRDNTFYLRPDEMKLADVVTVQRVGFNWFDEAKLWVTVDPFRALNLFHNAEGCKANPAAFDALAKYNKNMRLSRAALPAADAFKIPKPRGCYYLDYQKSGILTVSERLLRGHKAALIADPMGLGKTIEAIGLINYHFIDPSRVLVICPASLRINWARELDKWLVWKGVKAFPVLPGRGLLGSVRNGTLVISYNATLDDTLMASVNSCHWDLVIFDESHYLKNPEAKRTAACMAIAKRASHVLCLSGTPIPNRAHEFFSTLDALAPDVTGGATERQFNNRYTTGYEGAYGWQITAGRNQDELSCKLRGTGYMLRRELRSVLPQLPPERHSLVVIPQSTGTAEVIRKERNIKFTAAEILKAGKPLGYGAIPELRHEMGVEKLPDCISWIKDQMEGGLEKLVVFAYHIDVVDGLAEGLKEYSPVVVKGDTPVPLRQINVDHFQSSKDTRIIIGGWTPLGVGWTLTAAHTVVFVESSFVPGENNQCASRVIRIGQTAEGINIYYLVVEGSIDATVMAKAAGKQSDIDKVLN
jgi:SWI/SNF-related matrix-associated actin-dependent regulator 1 of chromatin subfamily A